MTTWTRAQQRQHRAAWVAKDAVGLAWEQGAVGLVGLNDGGATFADIAALIEAAPEGLCEG